jgi:two-component system response regulator
MTSRPVLLVEDNPDDQVLTLRALRKNNIINEVAVVGDGAEALELLLPDDGANGMLPGLVLLDLKLPKVDGLEVLLNEPAPEHISPSERRLTRGAAHLGRPTT